MNSWINYFLKWIGILVDGTKCLLHKILFIYYLYCIRLLLLFSFFSFGRHKIVNGRVEEKKNRSFPILASLWNSPNTKIYCLHVEKLLQISRDLLCRNVNVFKKWNEMKFIYVQANWICHIRRNWNGFIENIFKIFS